MTRHDANSDKPLDTNRLIGFIGGYLIAQGSLTIEQLDKALVYQVELAMQGQKRNLGEVLQQLGYVTRQELEQALQRQRQDISRHSH